MIKITFLVILFGLTACLNQKDNGYVQSQHKAKAGEDIREKVWNQLEKGKKDQIKGTWSDGTVRKITLTNQMGRIVDKAFIGKEVYLVDFTTKKNGNSK